MRVETTKLVKIINAMISWNKNNKTMGEFTGDTCVLIFPCSV